MQKGKILLASALLVCWSAASMAHQSSSPKPSIDACCSEQINLFSLLKMPEPIESLVRRIRTEHLGQRIYKLDSEELKRYKVPQAECQMFAPQVEHIFKGSAACEGLSEKDMEVVAQAITINQKIDSSLGAAHACEAALGSSAAH